MKKAELKEIMDKYLIFENGIDDAIGFVEELLLTFADETEKNEPYATNGIKRMRNAAREVNGLTELVWDAWDGDE